MNMRVLFAVMNTTYAVVKIKPEKQLFLLRITGPFLCADSRSNAF